MEKLLRCSPYYWEKAKHIDLAKRHEESKLSFMLFNQPPVCDAHCRRCFIPPNRRTDTVNGGIDMAVWKRIIDFGKLQGVLSLEISGEGEPLLSQNTLPIIIYAASIGIPTTLITNGHALNETLLHLLLDAGTTVVFSLHTLNADKYESDNWLAGSFKVKMAEIENAVRIFGSNSFIEAGYEIYRLAIHATLQSDNFGEVTALRTFCEERSIFFSIAPLANSGNAVLHPELRIDTVIEDVSRFGHNSIIHSSSSARIYGREVCGTAAFGMSFGWDGNLLLDAHGGYEIGDSLGNARTHDFDKLHAIWKTTLAKMFRETNGFCPVRDPQNFRAFIEKLKLGQSVL